MSEATPPRTIPQLWKDIERRLTVRKFPYWTTLRALSNTTVVRLTILLPLIGCWIILNDDVVQQVAKLSRYFGREVQDDPPWRLFATYFGLLRHTLADTPK